MCIFWHIRYVVLFDVSKLSRNIEHSGLVYSLVVFQSPCFHGNTQNALFIKLNFLVIIAAIGAIMDDKTRCRENVIQSWLDTKTNIVLLCNCSHSTSFFPVL